MEDFEIIGDNEDDDVEKVPNLKKKKSFKDL